jgi:DNA-binding NarL/FixJ family response regulator
LTPWAEGAGPLHIEQIAAIAGATSSCDAWAMIMINLGGKQITDENFAAELESGRSRGAQIPLVVLSDLDDSSTIAKAFEVGISGFLPMSTSVSIAFKALTFILHGGHFFPPSVLQPTRLRGGGTHASKGLVSYKDTGMKLFVSGWIAAGWATQIDSVYGLMI